MQAALVAAAREQLAPAGVLRAAINMSNYLLTHPLEAGGVPTGVSPDMAKAIAERLGVEVRLIPYKGPGLLVDAMANDEWDIGNVADEPSRAKVINFTPAYCEIQATYLVHPGCSIVTVEEVDKEGHTIAVKARAAYDLWLADNIQQAKIVRAETHDEAFDSFSKENYSVLAGLRPGLMDDAKKLPGSRVLDGCFTMVKQAIGCKPGNMEAAAFLHAFVEESKENGLIEELVLRHGVDGRLSVAQPVGTIFSSAA
jgi:polar amino acid transport system substrate-binding protein